MTYTDYIKAFEQAQTRTEIQKLTKKLLNDPMTSAEDADFVRVNEAWKAACARVRDKEEHHP